MIVFISLILVSLTLLAYYFLYYRPLKRMQTLAKNAQSLGYKVKLLPLRFMGYYIQKYFTQDQANLQILKSDWSKYDIIVGNSFTKQAIMVSNPKFIKDVLNQTNKFMKNPFITEVFETLAGGGMVFTEWQTWRRKRRIISSVFHFDFLNDIIPVIKSEINQQFHQIDQEINQGINSIDMKRVFSRLMSNVVAKCFFGTDMKEYLIEGRPYCESYVVFLEEIADFLTSYEHVFLRMKGYNYGLTKQSRQLRAKNDLLKQIAREITLNQIEKITKKKQKKKNILTALYQNGLLNLQSKQNPEQYTLDEVVAEFFAFFGAGTDTTTNALNIALHYLSEFPEYVKKIAHEYQSVKAQNFSPGEQIKQLKFADAVFNQSLRINGPTALIFSRICVEDVKIGGLDLSKHTIVAASPLLAHYNEKTFSQPHKFIPQRWLKEQKLQPFSFIPFSGGQRNCIGQYLARIQFKLILSEICYRYYFKALKPIKMKAKFVYGTAFADFEMKHKNVQ